MARTIAPGNPASVQPVDVKIPDIDLEIFDKLGDAKVKTAMQNFNLYATSTVNLESQKLYQQYKDNPIALANALSKLPEAFKDLPESVQRDMKGKLDSTAISLVTKAQANQEKKIIRQNKALAHTGSNLLMTQLADDYFNVLTYVTAPEGEKRAGDLAIYNAHRAQLAGMTALTDENGNPLFSESARAKMLMPKEAALAGFKNFIGRAESKQLKEWGENIFQNREKFMKDTGIDADTYDAMDQAYTRRLKDLEDTKVRTLHGQAYYDATNLITEPTQLNIEKAKAYPFADKKAIDKLVKNSKEMTQAAYYDPTRPTSPTAFLQTYTAYGDLLSKIPENPTIQEQQEIVSALAEASGQLAMLAKYTNLPAEEAQKIETAMKKALVDKMARAELAKVDFGNRIQGYYQSIDPEELRGPAKSNIQKRLFEQQIINKQEETLKSRYQTQLEDFTNKAARNYSRELSNAILYYLAGDYNAFEQAVAQADRNFDKTRAGFIVKSDIEWQRLENALAQGQPAMVEWQGRMLEFKGFDNRGAVFQERN